MELRAPWYVRLVGWILAAFGGVNVSALVWVLPALFAVGPDVLIAIVVLGVVPLVGGIGTIASRRWGWIVSLGAVTVRILYGIAAWAFQGVASPTAEGLDVEWTWLTFLVLVVGQFADSLPTGRLRGFLGYGELPPDKP